MLGGVIGAVAGLRIYLQMVPEQKWLATILIVLFLLIFSAGAAHLYGTGPAKFNLFKRWREAFLRLSGQTSTQWVFLGLALLASLFTAIAARIDPTKIPDFWLVTAMWIGGIILVFLGSWKLNETVPKMSLRTFLIAGGLFIVSTIIRVAALEKFPPLLNGDEASAGLNAVRFVEGQTNQLFGVGWFSFPSMYYAVQSISIRMFGQTTFALRFTSALIGGLTVSAVYLAGKRVFSERAGLLGALFLAGSHFHNHFSRIGLNNIWDAFWYVVVLGGLVAGWRSQRRLPFLLAGIGLGFAQYFYVSSRFLLVLVPFWLLLMTLIDRNGWKANRLNLFFLVFIFLVITLPLIWFFSQGEGWTDFLAPFSRVDLLGKWLEQEVALVGKPGWRILAEQVYASARTFISVPVQVWYPADAPLLRPVSAVLFLCGLILLLFQLRKPVAVMLYLWIGTFVLVGGFSVPVSSAQRFVAVIPGCALIIGFCLDECVRMISKVWQKSGRLLAAGVLLLVMGMVASDLHFYLYQYSPQTQLGGQNTLVAQRLALYLKDQKPMQVAFFGGSRMGYYSISSTAYLAPHIEGLDFRQAWGSADNPEITSDQVIFVFLPEERENLDLVRQDYPDGALTVEYDPYGIPLYFLYTVNLISQP